MKCPYFVEIIPILAGLVIKEMKFLLYCTLVTSDWQLTTLRVHTGWLSTTVRKRTPVALELIEKKTIGKTVRLKFVKFAPIIFWALSIHKGLHLTAEKRPSFDVRQIEYGQLRQVKNKRTLFIYFGVRAIQSPMYIYLSIPLDYYNDESLQ